jgi:hypothetical protein
MGIGTNLKEMALSFTRDDNLTGRPAKRPRAELIQSIFISVAKLVPRLQTSTLSQS